jgi:hypothetical protein
MLAWHYPIIDLESSILLSLRDCSEGRNNLFISKIPGIPEVVIDEMRYRRTVFEVS